MHIRARVCVCVHAVYARTCTRKREREEEGNDARREGEGLEEV